MTDLTNIKPSYDEWMYWAQVIVDRLTSVVHVFSHPPHHDVYMVEKERQFKLSQTVDILRHLHALTDEHELHMPKDPEDALRHELHLIELLQPVFRDVLRRLPAISADMQHLLRSPWFDNCAGKTATILFRGPEGRETEGIGSGMPENGRLPEVISTLLDRESIGDARAPREAKPRFAEPRMRREELARLWGKRNSSFLRSAGRVD